MLLRVPVRTELLSLAAARALGSADRIIAEATVNPEVLAFARRDAPRASAGTAKELAAFARAGESVLVVQSGPVAALAAELADLGVAVERAPVADES